MRIIVLDTLNPGSNKGEFCDERIASLNSTIGQDGQKPVVVFAHHPPFLVNEGPEPLHFQSHETMQCLCDTLQTWPSLKAIFCGHVHRGVAGRVGEIPVLVMPCIATPLRRGEYPPHLQNCPIYHVHRFDEDGEFTSEIQIVNDH